MVLSVVGKRIIFPNHASLGDHFPDIYFKRAHFFTVCKSPKINRRSDTVNASLYGKYRAFEQIRLEIVFKEEKELCNCDDTKN